MCQDNSCSGWPTRPCSGTCVSRKGSGRSRRSRVSTARTCFRYCWRVPYLGPIRRHIARQSRRCIHLFLYRGGCRSCRWSSLDTPRPVTAHPDGLSFAFGPASPPRSFPSLHSFISVTQLYADSSAIHVRTASDTGFHLVQYQALGQTLSCVRPVGAAHRCLSKACMEIRGSDPYRSLALGGGPKLYWFFRSRLDDRWPSHCPRFFPRLRHRPPMLDHARHAVGPALRDPLEDDAQHEPHRPEPRTPAVPHAPLNRLRPSRAT